MHSVSIIMSVFNAAPFLEEALNSLLAQTFQDFEIIVINDGSTDGSQAILESYDDPRLRVFLQENRGLSASLNRAISLSQGRYIARMDADDVSLPKRLAQQVAYLEQYPEVVIVGTTYKMIDSRGNTLRVVPVLCRDEWIRKELLFYSPFCHGSVMMRRDALLEVGCYNPEIRFAEDYDLWLRLGQKGLLANIPEVLYRYRVHTKAISIRYRADQDQYASGIAHRALERKLAEQTYLAPVGAEVPMGGDGDPFQRARKRVYANVCFRLGNEYSLRGRQAEARREFSLAVRYAPERPDYWVGLVSTFLPSALLPRLRRLRRYILRMVFR